MREDIDLPEENNFELLLKGDIKIWDIRQENRTINHFIYAIRYARHQKYGYVDLKIIERLLLDDIMNQGDESFKMIYMDYFGEGFNGSFFIWKREKGNSCTE